jgi:riboflavin kinase/FMN adenylyltransferase
VGAYFEDPESTRKALTGPPVICIGTFDGVHRGQQAILASGLTIAKTNNRQLLVITFHPHPKSVVAPNVAPLLLTEPAEKIALLRSYGADLVLQLRFDRHLASMSAGDFLDEILLKRLDVASLVIGHDFGFGRGREGTPEFLREWGRENNRQVAVVQSVTDDLINQRISSSLIRDSIVSSRFDQAVRLLGHPYPVSGEIVPGAARGRHLGYPTWNLSLSGCKLPPPVGIYAGWAGRRVPHPAMAYYGSNPTFGGEVSRLEAHLLEQDEPVATRPERVETIWLAAYVRPEVRFESADVLKKQLEEDERVVRDMMSAQREKNPHT